MFKERLMKAVRKNEGIVNDRTDRIVPMSKVLGFCLLNNNCIGLLFKDTYYSINEVYIGPDKMIHLSEWSVSGTVDEEDLTSSEGIRSFNNSLGFRSRAIKRVILLDGSIVTPN